MAGRVLRVSLEALDWEDETFRSSMEREVERLRASLRAVGLLMPIRVQPREGRFRVVSGFLRAEVARAEGMAAVDAEIVEGEDGDLLLKALHEDQFTRGFTWAEQCWVLARLVRSWDLPSSWVIEWAMPAMGLPSSMKLLEEHLRAAALPEPVLRAMIRHGCSMANALRLSRWPPEDQDAIVPLLGALHLGENLLRECLDLLREIGLRERVSPRELLDGPEVGGILEDLERDRPEKTAAFRAYLRRRRYPSLVSMEEAFGQARSRMGLPPQVSLQHGAFFEEQGVRLAFRARTAQEFREVGLRLWRACQKEGALEEIFAAARDDPT